jgi:CDP-diacylglycerol--serine O-phosphatidyltransferase
LTCIPVTVESVVNLEGPGEFRATLLERIANARERILISALYLQDDTAGREVLAAIYAASAVRPELQIAIFVDWHRAQRGLVGKAASPGNAALYVEMAPPPWSRRPHLWCTGAESGVDGGDAPEGLRHRRRPSL